MRRNGPPVEERFWSKVEKTDGCWNWIGGKGMRGRYGIFCPHGVGSQVTAHRFSAILKYGEIPENQVVRHKCDNGLCVNPDHLELGTQADNMNDMSIRGRSNKGCKVVNGRMVREEGKE